MDISETVKTVKRPEKVLQFGEGNFLRAFVDWMIDVLNEKTDFNGNVVVVQPLEKGMGDVINAQNGLYTTILRGMADGRVVEEFRPVSSISRCVNVYTQFDDYIKLAENPDLRFVVSNTTEAGITYNTADKLGDKPQRSFPGKVAAFLYHRWRYFKGDPDKTLVFIPCELIDKNGDMLREIVVRYAKEWGLEDAFSVWLEKCDFCNSLVDRVVPGYPREEAPTLCEKLGYTDNLLNVAEIFHLWVIETRSDYTKELPFVNAGLNVVWTKDMSFYRTRKVRILNGAHTMTVAAAFLCGLDTVEACCKDPLISMFLHKGIFNEIIPSMDGNTDQLIAYANKVLERFANPYIKHLLLSITLNSVSKFKTRVLPSIKGSLQKKGELPTHLVFSLSALIAFYEGKLVNGEMFGTRNGESYPIKDDEDVLTRFAALYQENADNSNKARIISQAVLSSVDWWGEDLSVVPGFVDAVANCLSGIWKRGIKAELERICVE
ncbi:MAG: tagaturonate reductase [Treponema sp.]|jgi:tagaturonate reductase|nr:tagaturonate reductase [Treponema sp.]